MTGKRRAKINKKCDEILNKNNLAPMTKGQHFTVWFLWVVIFMIGTGIMSIHLISFKYLFITIIFGLIIIKIIYRKK